VCHCRWHYRANLRQWKHGFSYEKNSLITMTAGFRQLSLTSLVRHSEGQEDSSCSKAATPAKRGKTPIGRLDELEEGQHPFQEKEPLKPFPGGVNPGI